MGAAIRFVTRSSSIYHTLSLSHFSFITFLSIISHIRTQYIFFEMVSYQRRFLRIRFNLLQKEIATIWKVDVLIQQSKQIKLLPVTIGNFYHTIGFIWTSNNHNLRICEYGILNSIYEIWCDCNSFLFSIYLWSCCMLYRHVFVVILKVFGSLELNY